MPYTNVIIREEGYYMVLNLNILNPLSEKFDVTKFVSEEKL